MPYASNRDRDPPTLELTKVAEPAAPLNLFMTNGYCPGVINLTWTDPSQLSVNSRFELSGVNVYRAFDSEYGPYERLNQFPLGTTFYRDQTDNVLVMDEVVEDDQWVMRGVDTASELGAPRYIFRTRNCPIVKEASQAVSANSIVDVEVRINGQLANIARVFGEAGEVEIDPFSYVDVATQTTSTGPIPDPGAIVTVTYRYTRSFLRTDLIQRVFYRVTTVGVLVQPDCGPEDPRDLLETSLERAAFTHSLEIEKIDYIWREAVRRNRWILDQGGERVKCFLRKRVGPTCPCFNTTTHHQPLNDCTICYGVGIVGGYEGPFDIVIAPDDEARKIAWTASGRTVEHAYEVWATSSPLLSQRDFLVKINGDRYSIGAVRMPSNRGMVLQQHFSIGHLDEKDIRYRVSLDNPRRFLPTFVQPAIPPMNSAAQITDKPNIPEERQLRGRTIAWENISY